MNRTFLVQTKQTHWRDNLFYLAYLFLFLDSMLDVYVNFGDSAVYAAKCVSQVCYLFFLGVCVLYLVLCLVLRESYSTMELLSVGGLLILGVLSYLLSHSHVFLDLTLMISISKNIDFEKFMKRLAGTLAIFLFIIICLSGLDILNSVAKTSGDGNSLGFGHPNTLGLFVFQLIAAGIVLERKNLKTTHLLLLFALGLIFYLVSKSRTMLLCVFLLVGAVLAYKWLSLRVFTSRQMKIFMSIIILIVFAAVFFVICYYWGEPDSMPFGSLAARIRQAKRYLNAYGLSAFGKEILTGARVAIPGYTAGYSYLDNGEIWYLIRLGIIGFAVYFYIYIRMIVKSINQEEFVLCITAAVYLFYTLTENAAMRIPFNFMVLYGGMLLYNENLLKHKEAKKRHICSD